MAVMSVCLFSSSVLLGRNLVCRSCAAFCPSLICRMAFCTCTVATLAGAGAAVWGCAETAIANINAGKTTIFVFNCDTPKILVGAGNCPAPTEISQSPGRPRGPPDGQAGGLDTY